MSDELSEDSRPLTYEETLTLVEGCLPALQQFILRAATNDDFQANFQIRLLGGQLQFAIREALAEVQEDDEEVAKRREGISAILRGKIDEAMIRQMLDSAFF